MLSRGILARDAQGREVRFGDRLVGKYVAGLGRASTDVRRLRSVGRAVLAVRSANAGVVELPGHRPVQRQYLHRLGDRGAIVVYVEAETGQVRGFIYTTARAAATTPSYEKCVGEDAKCGASPTRRTKSLALPLRPAACPTARPSSAGHGLGRRPVCCVDEYTATTEEAKGSTDSYCRSIGPQRQKAPHSRRPWGACRQGGSSVSGSSYGQASSHPHNQYQARHHGESLFACCVC